MVKARDALIAVGIGAVAIIAYFMFNRGSGAGGGLLGSGGQATSPTQGATSVSAPTAWNPTALFRSQPSLATGSANGAFQLVQTYSPFYSTTNSSSTTITNDSKTQNTQDFKLF